VSKDDIKLYTNIQESCCRILAKNCFPQERLSGLRNRLQFEHVFPIIFSNRNIVLKLRLYNKIELNEISVGAEGKVDIKKPYKFQEGVFKQNPCVIFKYDQNHSHFDKFEMRRDIMLLSAMKHDNILHCYGAYLPKEAGDILVVFQKTTGQTLAEFITKKKLFLKVIWNIVDQVAQGLHYIHSYSLVYTILRGDQVLIEDDYSGIKLKGFGSKKAAKLLLKEKDATRQEVGYIAPEVFKNNKFTLDSDVYSYGMLLYEVVAKTHPFGPTLGKDLRSATLKGERPTIPECGKRIFNFNDNVLESRTIKKTKNVGCC